MKDKDFDKIIEIMKENFHWKGEVGEDHFNYTNELIKSTKLFIDGFQIKKPFKNT